MNIIVAILVFGLIIFVHELGHFMLAKRAGVTIHEFSIGMGPQIFSRESQGIKYSLRMIPIGGYVAMEGEDDDSDDPNSFGKKSLKERFLTIFAGPFVNIVFCIILLVPVFFFIGAPTTRFGQVIDKSPAVLAGLQKDDTILSINGEETKEFNDISKLVNKYGKEDLTIKYKRKNQVNTVKLRAQNQAGRYIVGIQPAYEKNQPMKAVKQAFVVTYDTSKTMLSFLWKLVTGQLSGKAADALSGPVGVVKMVSNAATTGIINVIYLTAIISLNIGLMNLLPIPALDGWRILMLIIEAIRGGKKFPAKVEGYINAIGLFVILGLMLFVTYKDIIRLLT